VILGSVADSEAVVEIEIANFQGDSRRISVIVDTGYNGDLTLPRSVIAFMNLPSAGLRRARLADGGETVLQSFAAVLTWHGASLRVIATQTAGKSLLGMALLSACRLTIDVVDGGQVKIEPLQSPSA
jgi:clan AA aspartic protease